MIASATSTHTAYPPVAIVSSWSHFPYSRSIVLWITAIRFPRCQTVALNLPSPVSRDRAADDSRWVRRYIAPSRSTLRWGTDKLASPRSRPTICASRPRGSHHRARDLASQRSLALLDIGQQCSPNHIGHRLPPIPRLLLRSLPQVIINAHPALGRLRHSLILHRRPFVDPLYPQCTPNWRRVCD